MISENIFKRASQSLQARVTWYSSQVQKVIFRFVLDYISRKTDYVCLSDKGLQYVLHTGDKQITLRLLMGKEHLNTKVSRMVLWSRENLGIFTDPDASAVNVGANVGTMIVPLVENAFFKNGFCYEPDDLNFRLLKTNIALHNLEERVMCIKLALSNKEGVAQMAKSRTNHGAHTIVSSDGHDLTKRDEVNNLESETVQINISTLDKDYAVREVNLRKVGFVVVDIEGHEGAFLEGARTFLSSSNWPPMLLEFCPELLKNRGGIESFLSVTSNYKKVLINPLKKAPSEYRVEDAHYIKSLTGSKQVYDLLFFN